jgi:phospholipid/cholesterol/gamma-HCH transport system substrate-binding protein
MEREANYVAVGLFVLAMLAMGALFVYWYSDSRDHRHFTRYEIYFDGSVSGLSQGGPVRYLGVDVGRVRRIRLDPRSDNRVQVIADIDSTTPISERTLAQLSLQGITGLLYIDLQQQRPDDTGRRILTSVPSEQYPVIRSAHSDFDLFLSSLPELTARLNGLVERADRVLSDQNVKAISHLIGNADEAAASLPRSARRLDELIDALRASTEAAQRLIDGLQGTTRSASVDLLASMQELRTTGQHLASASSALDAFATENHARLDAFLSDSLPQFQWLLRDSRAAAHQIDELSRSLNENPSRLLYQPQASGVSIPP